MFATTLRQCEFEQVFDQAVWCSTYLPLAVLDGKLGKVDGSISKLQLFHHSFLEASIEAVGVAPCDEFVGVLVQLLKCKLARLQWGTSARVDKL